MKQICLMIMGHSFVRRLEDYTLNADEGYPDMFNLGFDGTKLQVYFIGQGGSILRKGQKSIQKKVSYITNTTDCILLQIGGNDLSDPLCNASSLATDIMSFASFLTEAYTSVNHVIIGQLLRRYSKRNTADYNDNIIYIYGKCKINTLVENDPNVSFWHHRGFWKNTKELMMEDGVHLNAYGMKQYAKSIQVAIGSGFKKNMF